MKVLQISNLIALLLLVDCGGGAPRTLLSMEDGWVRAMAPGMAMTAAYGRFSNNGGERIEIRQFSSDSFADVSLHRTTVEHGISKMEPLPGLTLAPGQTFTLTPGGLHLMMMHPLRQLQPGETIDLTLIAVNGDRFRFTLPVRSH